MAKDQSIESPNEFFLNKANKCLKKKLGTFWYSALGLVIVVFLGWAFFGFPGSRFIKVFWYEVTNPIPQARSGYFTVGIVVIRGDTQGEIHKTIARSLSDFKDLGSIDIMTIPRVIDPVHQIIKTQDSLGNVQANQYLIESGADILVWGDVLEGGSARLQLVYGNGTNYKSEHYQLNTSFELPELLVTDLKTVLATMILTKYASMIEDGNYAADKLLILTEKLNALLARAPEYTENTLADLRFVLADALFTIGDEKGNNDALIQSIEESNKVLAVFSKEQYLQKWIRTQNVMLPV